MQLEGKVAIVTGGSRGIGKAMAVALARAGARVVVAGRTESQKGMLEGTLAETVAEIERAGGQALAVKTDVTKDADIEALVANTLDSYGRLDILVNNAAVTMLAALPDLSMKRWDLILNVNLRGAVLASKLALTPMIKQKSGSIINISSIIGRRTPPGWVAYGVSKAAIERFSIGLAEEVKQHNIAVNCLLPAAEVETPGFSYVMKDIDKSHWASPEVMAKATVYLATLDARTFTGQVVTDVELLCWRDALIRGT